MKKWDALALSDLLESRANPDLWSPEQMLQGPALQVSFSWPCGNKSSMHRKVKIAAVV